MSDVCFQGEVSECGLACISFISKYYGGEISLNDLRKIVTPTELGVTLAEMTKISQKVSLSAQPVSFNVESLDQLPTPCIVHLSEDHYVVLERANSYCVMIMNPALGRQIIKTELFAMSLSGYALIFEGKKEKISSNLNYFFKKNEIKLDLQLLFYGLMSSVLSILLPALLLNLNNGFDDYNNLDFKIFVYFVIGQIISIIILRQNEKRKLRIEAFTMVQKTKDVLFLMLNNKIDFFERRNASDVSNKLLKFVAAKVTKSTIYNSLALNLLQTMFAIGVIYTISPLLVFTIFIFAIVSCLISWISRNKLAEIATINEGYNESVFKGFVESFNSISDIKSSNAIQNVLRHNIDKLNNYSRFQVQSGVSFLKYSIGQQIISLMETILTLFLCLWLVQYQNLPLSSVFLFFYIKTFFSSSFASVVAINNSFGDIDSAENRALDVIEYQKTEDSSQSKKIKGINKAAFTKVLQNNLSFNFPEFSINRGNTMAIVGRSGAGKTTLLKLLSGHFDNVEVSDENDTLVSNSELMASCYYQSTNQDFFSGTLRENLSIYNDSISDKNILSIMNYFGVEHLMKDLPGGLDTKISNYTNPFSAGEKQRLLLCRAFLSDKAIVLLDEPTCNLDQVTSNLIVDKLIESERTVIFTTHNLESTRNIETVLEIGFESGESK
ncbi:cysteine peptidase family C39 domain-containing protein [Vibrio parahaemolyticus]